jgi:hypothetical protein
MTCSIHTVYYILLGVGIYYFYKSVLFDYTKDAVNKLANEERLNGGFKKR